MKKIMILVFAVVALCSCEKKELTDMESINCLKQYDQKVENITNLGEHKLISVAEMDKRLNAAKQEYYDCLETGAGNK